MSYILGLDVHAGYGKIDWQKVATAGARFAIVKCTTGNDDNPDTAWNEGKDAQFEANVSGAKAAGLYVGAYLFAYPLRSGPDKPAGRSPIEQARRFYDDCRGLGKSYGELPPALDLEWPPVRERKHGKWIELWEKWDVDPAFISQWGRECAEEMTRLWGRKPLLYTYDWFHDTLRDGISYETPDKRFLRYKGTDVSWMRDYALWVPEASALQEWMPVARRPKLPETWTDFAFWQFGFNGSNVRFPGVSAVPLDRNVFNGTLDELRTLAQVTSADTLPEIDNPSSEPTVQVDVPSARPDPLGKVYSPPEFARRRYDNGPGEPDDAA